MAAQRTSLVWSLAKEEFAALVRNSTSYKQVLAHFGLQNKGSNFKTLRRRLLEEEVDFSHFRSCGEYLKAFQTAIPLELILVENSDYNRGHLKRRLLETNSLKNECSACGQNSTWNNQPLVLTLDHINGISNDNRLENLRMLCPNCHSQTSSFAGRNVKRTRVIKSCLDCGKNIGKKSSRCRRCNWIHMQANALHPTKIIYPSDLKLVQMVKETSFVAVGKKLGVSDNAIRKRLRVRKLLYLI